MAVSLQSPEPFGSHDELHEEKKSILVLIIPFFIVNGGVIAAAEIQR
jgi:hypothetical protein